jgi:hypothetical protein
VKGIEEHRQEAVSLMRQCRYGLRSLSGDTE